MGEIVLQATGLHRTLGEGDTAAHVLRGVDIQLTGGRMHSIVGPSGCGKSTLLYILGLLDKQDAGSIQLCGEDISATDDALRTAARSQHLGFVFQFHFLLPEFTAAENVEMPMRKLGTLPKKEIKARSRELLAAVGLETKAGRLATQLSGGEQQRVAVARALANQPSVILADEPTGNLDAKNSDRVFELLSNLCAQYGQAVLMVTHNPALAQQCGVQMRMRDGQFETAAEAATSASV